MTPLSWFLALRFLRQQPRQALLMMLGAGVGVAVVVFISALIEGLQLSLIDKTLSAQPHLTIEPYQERARPLLAESAQTSIVRSVVPPEQRIRSISEWGRVERRLRAFPGVTATAALARGAGFALRGNASRPVTVLGTELDSFERIIPVLKHLVAGSPKLSGSDALIGVILARNLGARVGDRLRVQTAEGGDQIFTVRGLFETGNRELDERWFLVSLRNGQTLFDLSGGVSAIYANVADVYAAARIGQRLAGLLQLEVSDWMSENQQLLVALQSQSASTNVIRAFVMLAVAIGIASVLAISVLQRSREIGILRATGVSAARVAQVFVIEGALISVGGWILGSLLGALASQLFRLAAVGPDGGPLFPIALHVPLFLRAGAVSLGVGILAALIPARRAARLDPAEAIRHV